MMLPKSIQIQTIDYCNRKCTWCPNSKMEKSPSNLMPWEVFKKILFDLAVANYTGAIHLYLMAEPLCDPRMKELVRETRLAFPSNEIMISTNGDYLNKDLASELLDAGLTWIAVSYYDNCNDKLSKITDKRVVKTSVGALRMEFYNRAGHVPHVACISPMVSCNWVFDKAYINYRGDVILCCSDYDYEVVFGNVVEDPFYNIYNGVKYNEYRDAHRAGRGKEMPLCKNCNRIKEQRQ